MHKVLVAVDGSSASIHAANLALAIAKGMGATVSLVHVSAPTLMPGDVPLAPVAELREAELARGQKILEEVSAQMTSRPAELINLLGAPAETVADAAEHSGFDLAVVGNKGRSAVSRVLLGSVADRLVHICKRPVLVVR